MAWPFHLSSRTTPTAPLFWVAAPKLCRSLAATSGAGRTDGRVPGSHTTPKLGSAPLSRSRSRRLVQTRMVPRTGLHLDPPRNPGPHQFEHEHAPAPGASPTSPARIWAWNAYSTGRRRARAAMEKRDRKVVYAGEALAMFWWSHATAGRGVACSHWITMTVEASPGDVAWTLISPAVLCA